MESTCLAFKLGDPIESAIFRIVQESLLNIERHAQASHVKINLSHTDKQCDVLIQDNGVDMSIDSELKTGCYGLIAMQERVYTLDGTNKIGNTEPRGVLIHASTQVEPSSFA